VSTPSHRARPSLPLNDTSLAALLGPPSRTAADADQQTRDVLRAVVRDIEVRHPALRILARTDTSPAGRGWAAGIVWMCDRLNTIADQGWADLLADPVPDTDTEVPDPPLEPDPETVEQRLGPSERFPLNPDNPLVKGWAHILNPGNRETGGDDDGRI
jgi:hypothetical protein